MRWYILGAVATAALGVLAWVIHFPGLRPLRVRRTASGSKGSTSIPNAFGPYLVPAAVICLEDLMRPRLLRWPAPLVLLTFITLLLGIVLTFSRAATANLALACLVVVFVYAMRTDRRKALVRGLAILAACTVCAAGALVQTGAISILQDRAQTQGYDSQRFSTQAQAVDMGSTRLLGYGPGAVQTELSLNTHSTFVWSLFENGILGFAALLLLVLSTAATAWRSARADSCARGPRRRRAPRLLARPLVQRAGRGHVPLPHPVAARRAGLGRRECCPPPGAVLCLKEWARKRARDQRRLYAHAD